MGEQIGGSDISIHSENIEDSGFVEVEMVSFSQLKKGNQIQVTSGTSLVPDADSFYLIEILGVRKKGLRVKVTDPHPLSPERSEFTAMIPGVIAQIKQTSNRQKLMAAYPTGTPLPLAPIPGTISISPQQGEVDFSLLFRQIKYLHSPEKGGYMSTGPIQKIRLKQ